MNLSSENDRKSFITGLLTGIVVLAILGGVYMLGQQSSEEGGSDNNVAGVNAPTQPNAPTPTQPQLPQADGSKVAPVTDADHIKGGSNAKITMIEYSDFECPFCSRFVPTVEQALTEYGNDIRVVFRHFPLRSIHQNAQKAAEASECAAEQGSFWEMHDELFELAAAQSLSVTTMKQAAADIGLNTGSFNDCLDTDKYADEVEKDYQDGIGGGVSGTPGTFINGQYVPGAVPFAQVKSIIDSLL